MAAAAAGVAVAAALLGASGWYAPSPVPQQWVSLTLQLALSSPGGEPRHCYFVNSTAHSDRFCLALIPGPAGYIVNGTFDHGPGTPASPVYLAEGPPCVSDCRTSATWTSPDGTGRIVWEFTPTVTLTALD